MTGDPSSEGTIRGVAGAMAVLLFAALLWGLLPVLNPFLLFLALVGVLLPFRHRVSVAPLLAVAGGLSAFWLLSELGGLLTPFVLAIGVAYILNPIVSWLASRNVLGRWGWDTGTARSVAVLVLIFPLLGAGVAAFVWGGPWFASELGALMARLPILLERAQVLAEGWEDGFLALRIPGVDPVALLERLQALDAEDALLFFEAQKDEVFAWLRSGALGVGRGVGVALTLLSTLVLTPVIGFYLLRDWDAILARLAALVPERQARLLHFGREYDRLLAAYLRGQVAVSAIVGGVTALGLLAVQFPAAILLGAIVAIFNVVPYLGVVLSLVPAVAIAFGTGAVGTSLLKVIIVYGVAQTLESAVFSPRIVGDSTGLHPVWILLAISVAGFFFGFVGLLLAVPLAVGVKLILAEVLRRSPSAPASDASESASPFTSSS